MADEIRINRPVTPQPSMQQAVPQDSKSQKSSKLPWIILAVVVVVVLALGIAFRDKLMPSQGSVKGASIKNSDYQAVFLTNGQVYFGKVSNATGDYVTLRDIYYLQVTQPQLQGSQATSTAQSEASPQISLVKLGNELHGPSDEMHINRSQVLFYEDLKEESQVVKAIKDYKANPTK